MKNMSNENTRKSVIRYFAERGLEVFFEGERGFIFVMDDTDDEQLITLATTPSGCEIVRQTYPMNELGYKLAEATKAVLKEEVR